MPAASPPTTPTPTAPAPPARPPRTTAAGGTTGARSSSVVTLALGVAALLAAVVACAYDASALAIALAAVGGGSCFWWFARRQSRAGAAEGRRQVEALFESIIEPLVVIRPDGRIVQTNAAVETVFGWPPDELIGRNVNVLMGEPYRSEHDEYVRAYLETGIAKAIGRVRKVLGRHRDGRDFPVEISISELGHGRSRSERRFIGMVRDVSDREQMTAMLNHAERLAAVGELAASVAHEVNNPVNTIINCIQLVKDGDTDPELFDDIDAEANRIAEIVRELLDLARDNKESISSLSLHGIVVRTLALMRRRMLSKGVSLEVDVPEHLPLFLGRQQEIQQVLLNLVMNAQDALQELPDRAERTLRISGEAAPAGADGTARIRLVVRDNGPGIPRELHERIFEPFYTSKRGRGGSGLGLAVSRRIVERYGGRMTVTSEPGSFSEFCIELPVVGRDAEERVDGSDLPDR